MAGRNRKSRTSRRATARRNNREAQKHPQNSGNGVNANDGSLFMRAFGKAREVINVTRILAGLKSVSIERDDNRTPDKLQIQDDELIELCVTVDELRPQLARLCRAKSQSAADKAKHAADKPVPARNPAPEKLVENTRPSNALVPVRRGRVVDANSLYVEASGRAKTVSNYIRILAGLPKQPQQAVDILEIEGDNLDELIASLVKLNGSYKKGPRARNATIGSSIFFGSGRVPHYQRVGRMRPQTSDRERARAGPCNRCPSHWPRRCSCELEDSDSDSEVVLSFMDVLLGSFFF